MAADVGATSGRQLLPAVLRADGDAGGHECADGRDEPAGSRDVRDPRSRGLAFRPGRGPRKNGTEIGAKGPPGSTGSVMSRKRGRSWRLIAGDLVCQSIVSRT